MLTWSFRVFIKIIACFFVLVYPTCLAGGVKTVAKFRAFVAVNDVLPMQRVFAVHRIMNNWLYPYNRAWNGERSTRIAEARNNGQNYRFSKLLSYPHKDWSKWGIFDYFSERWHLRSTLMKQVGNRHLTDLWAVLVQGHGRIIAPEFYVAHR